MWKITSETTLERDWNFKVFFIWTFSYVLALGAGIGVVFALNSLLNDLWIILIADIAATFVIFVISTIIKNTSLYDPYWSVIPIIIVFYWWLSFAVKNKFTTQHLIIIVLVSLWGVRLTYNWTKGWLGIKHEDWRYVKYRKERPKLFWLINLTGLQMMPTLVVYLSCLSLYPALTQLEPQYNFLFYIGVIIVLCAIFVETLADEQLRYFKRSDSKLRIITTGLWSVSRHPNYFGEISFWWGLFFIGLSYDPSFWWTISGPITIVLLFIVISIPMMEKRLLEKYPEYEEYKKKVSMLIPWFKKKK